MLRVALLVALVTFLGTPHLTDQRRFKPRDLIVMPDFNPPRIFPDEKEYVVTAGRNLTLRCEGKQPLTWDFPKNPYNEDNMQEAKNRISVSETPDVDNPYGLLLELFNLSHVDVGYYSCVFNTTDYTSYTIEELEETGKLRRIYIYVEDPAHLMVSSQNVVTAIQYTSLTIPCRPTSPRVEVTLYQNDEKVTDSVNFDPHKGFDFVVSSVLDNYYTCIAKRGNQTEEQNIVLILSLHTVSVPKPQINDSYNGNTVIGGEILLDCFIRIDPGIAFDLYWDYPNPKIDDPRLFISNTTMRSVTGANNIPQRIGKSTLSIKNVTRADEGHYVCFIKDANNNQNSDKKLITVLENGTSFVELEEPAGHINVTTKAGKVARWLISVNSFPIAQITWFDNHNNEITAGWADSPSSKYSINTTHVDTQLRISKLTLADSGVYRVMADNTIQPPKFLNLTLNVKDKPDVVLEAKKFYIHGMNASIACQLAGYPPPQVNWFFQPCVDQVECTNVPYKQIPQTEYVNTQVNGSSVTSVLTMLIERSGALTCAGYNSEGKMNDSSIFYESDIENGFGISGYRDSIVEGDDVTLICSGSKFSNFKSLNWYQGYNGSLIENSVDAGITVTHSSTNYSDQAILSIQQGNKQHNGQYVCKSSSYDDIEPSEGVTLTFKDPVAPSIYRSNMDNKAIRRESGEQNVHFYCYSRGLPVPDINWYKDNVLMKSTNDSRVLVKGEKLEFKFIKEEDNGKYSCVSKNRISSDSRFVELSSDTREFKAIYLGIIIALAIFFIILIVYLVWKIRKEQKIRKELSIAGLLNFEEGATESLNPDLGIDEQADLLPYDKKWEFPREKLKLGKQLGSGAFGVVMKAEAHGIVSDEEYTKVAVKMVKKTAESAFIKALASELKIMVHLGKHLNVVNLLGACTKNVTKRELYVIVEYCRFGNIHNYLLRNRCKFIDQIVQSTDAIDSTIGYEIINRAYSVSSNKRYKEIKS